MFLEKLTNYVVVDEESDIAACSANISSLSLIYLHLS